MPVPVILIDSIYRKDETIILKCFLINIIHFIDSNGPNNSNQKVLTKEIQMKKIK